MAAVRGHHTRFVRSSPARLHATPAVPIHSSAFVRNQKGSKNRSPPALAWLIACHSYHRHSGRYSKIDSVPKGRTPWTRGRRWRYHSQRRAQAALMLQLTRVRPNACPVKILWGCTSLLLSRLCPPPPLRSAGGTGAGAGDICLGTHSAAGTRHHSE